MGRQGFTLIELLVVVTILALLATLGLPRVAATRQRATVASMMSDLKNLATGQVGFFASYGDFAGGVAGAEVAGPGARGRVALVPSPGNTITVTRRASTNANGAGWSAVARNPTVSNPRYDVCGIYMGSASYAPNRAVNVEGAPICY